MNDFPDINGVIKGWKKFISIVANDPTKRPVTLEAWKRCKDMGLEQDKMNFSFLSDEELEQKVQSNSELIENAKPYMEHISLSLIGKSHMVTLSDCNGWIINYCGTPQKLGGGSAGFYLGSCWSEKVIGNNGIGTALATGKPVLIYGIEHFEKVYCSCVGFGVPIKNNGKIIGALNVVVPTKYAHPTILNLVVACVNSIETTISNLTQNPFGLSTDKKLSAASELIATAVHDIKNPIAVIRGLSELGKLTSDKDETNNYFSRIIKQVDEMNSMVVDLLSIFRPEELTSKAAVPVIEDVLQQFVPVCKSKGIKLSFINNGDEHINMCERLFRRSIENLITNAVQIMDDGGLIEIQTKIEEDFLIIAIKDTAGGIPDDIKDCLFEAYTFKRSEGTGLGLFMVYHAITNTHKGHIYFETQSGQGTTFFIKLPVVKGIKYSSITQRQLI